MQKPSQVTAHASRRLDAATLPRAEFRALRDLLAGMSFELCAFEHHQLWRRSGEQRFPCEAVIRDNRVYCAHSELPVLGDVLNRALASGLVTGDQVAEIRNILARAIGALWGQDVRFRNVTQWKWDVEKRPAEANLLEHQRNRRMYGDRFAPERVSWDDLIDDANGRQRKSAAPRIAVRDLLLGICEQVINHHDGQGDLGHLCAKMVNDFLSRVEQIERVCGFKRPGVREPRQISCGNLVTGTR